MKQTVPRTILNARVFMNSLGRTSAIVSGPAADLFPQELMLSKISASCGGSVVISRDGGSTSG